MPSENTENTVKMHVIAKIYTGFPSKFGVPRQSGLASDIISKIIFEKEYRTEQAVRGLEGFSHIWLLWHFSMTEKTEWSPTVRPPRLGGNKRVGIFATRYPFRPNPIGLSSVKLLKIEQTKEYGPVLYVSGADMTDGTPIFDIKPYLSFTDAHPEAIGGFSDEVKEYSLNVSFPQDLLNIIPDDKRKALIQILSQDPRPSYQNDPERIYGFVFGGYEIKFTVENENISVCGVDKIKSL